ncbi:MAG: VWA domain-containing protein [Bdellovibrionales bacterium]|nr:VWA domain-containing protein [Bdellovibrionales bacterium]
MKLKSTLLLMLLSLGLVALFQNCGNVSLQVPEEVQVTAKSTADGHICPIAGEEVGIEARIVFIVDMSLSNLGLGQAVQLESGSWNHTIDFSQQTDRAGQRFSVMTNLIQNISAANSASKFSVIGFHDEAILDDRYESCSSGFIDSAQATSAVNSLRSLQAQTDNAGRGTRTGNQNSPFAMKNTSYLAALRCLEEKMMYEISSGNRDKNLYNVVFLTDGKPTDRYDPCYFVPYGPQRDQCYAENPAFASCGNTSNPNYYQCVEQAYSNTWYKSILETMNYRLQSKIGGIKLFPVYYGPSDNAEDASEILDPLAEVFDINVETLAATDFAQISEYIEDAVSLSSNIIYQVKNFMAINLTALPSKDLLEVDSNMDGVPDSQQSSIELQSGIREIFDSYVDNFNQDEDLLPSFIEKIRGLSTTLNDSNLNYDGDNFLNYEEVQVGRDVNSSDIRYPMPIANLNIATISRDENRCEVGGISSDLGIKFNVNQMVVIPDVNAYVDPNPSADFNFSHAADENIILLTYVAEPLNSLQDKKYLFGLVLKAKFYDSRSFRVNIGEFKLLGELQ